MVQQQSLFSMSLIPNAQSTRSNIKLPDATITNNLKTFQDLVYSERFDIIMVTESTTLPVLASNEINSLRYFT